MSESTQHRSWQLNTVRTGPRGGTPVVFVHPVGLDLTYWDRQIVALHDTFDVVAFDLPGHGSSPAKPEDWTLPQAVSFMEQIVEQTGSTSAHIVGLSVGGVIAQAFAIAKPERVRSLVLFSTAPSFSEQGRDAMHNRANNARSGGMQAVLQECLQRWFTPSTLIRRPDLVDRVKKTLLADDPAIHGAMWDMISGIDFVDQLGTIRVPTLIVTGELDPSSPPSSAQLLHDGIVGSEVRIVPGYSHMLPLEAPDLVNGYLLTFLQKHQAGLQNETL